MYKQLNTAQRRQLSYGVLLSQHTMWPHGMQRVLRKVPLMKRMQLITNTVCVHTGVLPYIRALPFETSPPDC